MGNRLLNLKDQRFGRLIVLSREGTTVKGRMATWLCQCDCGNLTIVISNNLRRGHTTSCSCYRDQEVRIKHNHAIRGQESGEYSTWRGMIQRCHNPEANGYENYGGRGISVCDDWRISFNRFISDMGPKPNRSYSIDRIEVNGNYEKSNCRWATPTEQASNKRKRGERYG